MTARRWLISISVMTAAALIAMAGWMWAYDPFCYYRMPNDRYIVNSYRFLNAGLIRNAHYDAAVVGSSMAQNFDMKRFRDLMGITPIKLTLGAMSPEGFDLLHTALLREGRARTIVLCADLPPLAAHGQDMKVYPTYLYDDEAMNDFKYLLGCESWTRLMPLSLVLGAMNAIGVPMRRFYGTKDIDEIGAWEGDFPYGEDIVLSGYLAGGGLPSRVDTDGLAERMAENAEKIYGAIERDADTEYIIFFPPYSALYWSTVIRSGAFDAFMETKRAIVRRFDGVDRVRIFDFQYIPEIADLNDYRDITHYSSRLNDMMTELMARGDHEVDGRTIDGAIDLLRTRVDEFERTEAGRAALCQDPQAITSTSSDRSD